MNSEQLKENLQQFIGTEHYYKLGLYRTLATDGVFYFCKTAEAFWLFDEIAHFVTYKTKEPFVTVIAESDGRKGRITFEDGNYNKIGSKELDYTDLPEGEWKFFVTDNVVMLPNEY
jgi:hypothetical protein